jgi:hypothetical protein
MIGLLTRKDVARSVILVVVIPLAAYEIFYGPSAPVNVGAAVIMAIGLFSVRRHHGFLYGAMEIAFGIAILVFTWAKGRGGFSSGFSNGFATYEWRIILVQTFAAIYILVRGLDNLEKGSREGFASYGAIARLHTFGRRILSIL